MHVVVVGGGIAGLATAYYLQQAAEAQGRPLALTVLEGGPAFGGKIVTRRRDDFVIEGGPDSFVTQKPAALKLCRELGLDDQLIGTRGQRLQSYVWSGGRLRPLPEGLQLIVPTRMWPFVRSSLISWPGKLRMGLDLLLPRRRAGGDESLAGFVRRRLGREALDKLAEPLIAGIYVADAERMSLQSTFPRFAELERRYRSLIIAMLRQRRVPKPAAPAPPLFMTLRGGLGTLVSALVDRLSAAALLTHSPVARLTRRADTYHLTLADGRELSADAVVLATPAYVAAALVRELDPALSAGLDSIRYVSTANVSLAYRRADLGHPFAGSGFVVPSSARRGIRGCTWSSAKFEGRAPEAHVLLRVFVGGAGAEQLADQDDAQLVRMVREELRVTMGLQAEPVLSEIFRWPRANAQYDVGHQERIEAIERRVAAYPGLYLAGSAYHGVGLPDCIEDGQRVALALVAREEEVVV